MKQRPLPHSHCYNRKEMLGIFFSFPREAPKDARLRVVLLNACQSCLKWRLKLQCELGPFVKPGHVDFTILERSYQEKVDQLEKAVASGAIPDFVVGQGTWISNAAPTVDQMAAYLQSIENFAQRLNRDSRLPNMPFGKVPPTGKGMAMDILLSLAQLKVHVLARAHDAVGLDADDALLACDELSDLEMRVHEKLDSGQFKMMDALKFMEQRESLLLNQCGAN